jgi:CBS domain-containing protein
MKVKDIMTNEAIMIGAGSTLIEAARRMREYEIGALPVTEGDTLVGMITDRDIIVWAIAEDKDPAETRVSEIMTPEVFYCHAEDDIEEAARIMKEKTIRRLCVVDEQDKPVGFVSLTDFAVKSHDERLVGELLGRVSEQSRPHW